MSFKILIVEDEELYADKLEMLVDKLDYQHLATVDNSRDAIAILEKELPDLILMDIYIYGEYDGIELVDIIQQNHSIPIIFITSLEDDLTFKRASRTNPVNFIVKPFNELQLQRTIELTVKKLDKKPSDTVINQATDEWENDFLFQNHFFIKTRQRLEKVAVESVLYLEADGHYCQVHTTEKKFLVRIASKELLKKMPLNLFVQTHRSFWVNLKRVDAVDLQDSVLNLGKKHVPLSKRNREMVLKKLDWV
ncbi:MAG: LytR/AlgR family response regulator transcription factor [Saprospiraceae bacterium]